MSTTAKEAVEALNTLIINIPWRRRADLVDEIHTLLLYLEHRQRIESHEPPMTAKRGAAR